jgi:hypothetical protein
MSEAAVTAGPQFINLTLYKSILMKLLSTLVGGSSAQTLPAMSIAGTLVRRSWRGANRDRRE